MLTVSGTSTKWLHLKMPFLPTVLSYAPSATKSAHAQSMRSCATTGTGKSVLMLFPLSVLSDSKPSKTVSNSGKRIGSGVCLAHRKHRHCPHTACPPLTTRTRKVQLYARQAKHTHHVVPVERVIPSSGGRRQRAYQRPYYAMRAVSHGANTQI